MAYNDLSGPYHYAPAATTGHDEPPTNAEPVEPPPPSDRLGVHIVIETLLALVFAGALFFLYRDPDAGLATADGRHLAAMIAVPILLVTIAAATSLRVGLPNLAIGAIAAGAGVVFSLNSPRGAFAAAAITLGIVLAAGVVLAIIVIVVRAPGWLASGVVAVAVTAWVSTRDDVAPSIDVIGLFPASTAWIVLVSLAALSIIGGIVTATARVRDRLHDCRDAASGGGPRPVATAATMLGGLVTSTVLSGLAGIWITWTTAEIGAEAVYASLDPVRLTLIAFAAALIGGTSAFGRIGGVLGTVLAALTTVTLVLLLHATESTVDMMWVALGGLVLGAVVNRLVEWLGPGRDDDWTVEPASDHPAPPPADEWHDPYR